MRYGSVTNVKPIMLAVVVVAVAIFIRLELDKKEKLEALPDRTPDREPECVPDMKRDMEQTKHSDRGAESVCVESETQILSDDCGMTGLLTRENYSAHGRAVSVVELDSGHDMVSVRMDSPEKIIGRDARLCDVCVQGRGVSRRHALVCSDSTGIFVKDMESTNGTFVNGIRLSHDKKWRIDDNDIVRIGEAEYRVAVHSGQI